MTDNSENVENSKRLQVDNSNQNEVVSIEISNLNTKTEKDKMEVHHHAHHGHEKKTWKHYFWEFFMLFLAVFCGFLAELQLEHKIERDREKELAEVLFEEVKNDSLNLIAVMQLRKNKEEALKHLIKYFKDSSLSQPTKSFYESFTWFNNTANTFDPKDGMLDQLKNSGALRYFKNLELQKAIGDYGRAINLVRNRNENEYTFTVTIGRQFSIKHYDFEWFQQLTENGKYSMIEALVQKRSKLLSLPPRIRNLSTFNIEEALGILGQNLLIFQGTRSLFYNKYALANHNLQQVLRNNYHFE